MKEEKKESPIGVLWGWGKLYHGKFIGSIILAVLGVACQMVPYFCVAHIVTMMLSGEQTFSRYVTAGIIALCGYLGKVLFSCLSTTISHTATYPENHECLQRHPALGADLRAALRFCILALRQSGAFHLPVHCDFLAGADRADYCGLYLYGRFGRTGDKCGRNQPASERRRTEP